MEESKDVAVAGEDQPPIIEQVVGLVEARAPSEVSESVAPFEFDAEAAANVSSAIMFKVPTKALAPLRLTFENSAGHGLNLVQFLEAFVRNMDLDENVDELLRIIPDLLDFFKSVDINGDGRMEWSEFVAFVIESVVSGDPPIMEKFVNVNRHGVQPAGQRNAVKVSKMMPEFNRLFIGVGAQIIIYETDDRSDTWLSNGVRINLITRDAGGLAAAPELALGQPKKEKEKETGPRSKVDKRMQQALSALDFVYLSSREMLIVLRSDVCLEFHKFMTRSKIHADFILQNGIWPLTQPYNKLAIRETRLAPWRLFAIGENRKVVDSWQISVNVSGAVELSDYQALEKHTDFLRDVLVIHNDLYDLLVTCGMDKKVHLWDLTTLRYKATRSGHRGGVQCLAFDNHSLLFAGGFDFRIIAWDLDAEIDRPIFQLWGHGNVVTRVVAVGSINRAFSLDAGGQLKLWDTSKSNPSDKEARQIDEVSFTEDTFRCLEVLRNVSASFTTANRVIINVQGRRNHVYKLVNMAPAESAPLPAGVLFSSALLMVITVHSKDVLFFSAATGSEQNKLDRDMLGLELNPGTDLQVAVLDDRERKLILGDSAGCIAVYNCLSGVRLKTLATQVPFACRFMIYTPDKLLVTIAGPGELYIFDELPNFPTKDTTMRDTRAHDVDVVALAYSYELGLIATADCTGTVCVWSFEFVTLEAIIHECTGTDIGQIAFIGKYPLLLVTDSFNNFSIISVGPAYEKNGKTIWRVECDLFINPLSRTSNAADLSILELDAQQLADRLERDVILQDQHVGGATVGADGEEVEEEEEEDQGGGKRPLTRREINEYLRLRRDCKSMTILIQKSSRILQKEATSAAMADPHTAGKDLNSVEYRLDRLLGASNPFRPANNKKDELNEEEDAAFLAAINGTKAYDPEDELKEKAPQGASVTPHSRKRDLKTAGLPTCMTKGFPAEGLRIFALCGFDDGSVTITDLTPAMRDIALGELESHEFASNQPTYDPRRYANRKVTDFDRNVWTKEEVSEKERFTSARLSLVLNAHSGAVTTLGTVCSNYMLTSGTDQGVYLWTLDGRLVGTLTRGREWDKLFRPRWVTPVDMATREQQRRSDAQLLARHLGLKGMMKKRDKKRRPGESEKELVFGEVESADGGGGEVALSASVSIDPSLATAKTPTFSMASSGLGDAKNMLKTAFHAADSELHKNKHEHAHHTDQSVLSLMSGVERDDCLGGTNFEDEPDRSRVVGQLHGRVTYHMSTKDAAKQQMLEKEAETAEMLLSIGKTKKKAKRLRRGGGFALDWDVIEEPGASGRPKAQKSVAARYLDDLMSVSSSATSADGLSKDQLAAETAKALGQAKPRKIRTKYDIELAQLDADDPNNWEIHSSNRQRALYHRLYLEMDKKGYTKDPMAIFEAKLNALSPGGDFRVYLASLREAAENQRRQRLQDGSPVNATASAIESGVSVQLQGVAVSVVQLGDTKLSTEPLAYLQSGLSSPAQFQSHSHSHLQPAEQLSASSFLSAPDSPSHTHSHISRPMSPELRSPSLTLRPPPVSQSQSHNMLLTLPAVSGPGGGAAAAAAAGFSKPGSPSSLPHTAAAEPLVATSSRVGTNAVRERHRLTPAQLAAMQEREAVLSLTEKFEAALKTADRAGRQAGKKIKQQKLEYRKMTRSLTERMLGLGITDPAVLTGVDHSDMTMGVEAGTRAAVTVNWALPPLASPSRASSVKSPSSPKRTEQVAPHTPGQGHSSSASASVLHPMNALISSVLSVEVKAAPHPITAPLLPNTRHSVAKLLMDKQTSIDGVMAVSQRQKEAEQNWVRKVKAMMLTGGIGAGEGAEGEDSHGNGLGASGRHRGGKSKRTGRHRGTGVGAGSFVCDSADGGGADDTASLDKTMGLQKQRQMKLDRKISERTFFGPYAAKELLVLLKAFQSLPQVFVPPDLDAGSGFGGGGVASSVSGERDARDKGKVAEGEDGDRDEDDWDGFEDEDPIDGPGGQAGDGAWTSAATTEAALAAAAAAAEEEADPALAAARAAERLEKAAEEQAAAAARAAAAERARIEAEEEEAEALYQRQVLATSIKLQLLAAHPFMKLRPAMKTAVDKYIAARCVDGVLPHNVLCALCDLPAACCPLMKPEDRKQLLRLFVINIPSQDVAEAAQRGVTVQQLAKLRQMFKFFDKDGSGGIDKEEILEVLVKLQENSGGGGQQEVGEDLIKDVMGSCPGDELSFDDFARVFKGLVQNENN